MNKKEKKEEDNKGDKDGPVIGSNFDFKGGWKEDKHRSYHEDYDIKKLFLK